jgi:hypothetical protein
MSPIGTITVPWDDLESTGPEVACLAADPMVGAAVIQTFVPVDVLGPNSDLSLRFTTAPATRVVQTSGTVLSVQRTERRRSPSKSRPATNNCRRASAPHCSSRRNRDHAHRDPTGRSNEYRLQICLMTVIMGIDPHKATHTAVAIDGDERPIARLQVVADRCRTQRLLAWAAPFGEDRQWAIESAAGLGQRRVVDASRLTPAALLGRVCRACAPVASRCSQDHRRGYPLGVINVE